MTKDKSILIKNIYYMLSYAFTTLRQSNYEDIAKERFDNVHNLFAAILAKGIGKQLKQGLYREYLNKIEDTSSMRGKIDMQGSIKNKLAKKQLLSCAYDELSENNTLNQILKTTVYLLLRNVQLDAERKNALKAELPFFSNVDIIDPRSIKWATIRFQRNKQTYRMLISLCQLILEGMLLTTEAGAYKMATFVDEQSMCRLYEKFILEYYRKEFPTINVSTSHIKWAIDDGFSTMLPSMQSDVMLEFGGKVLIIDAKYYTNTTCMRYDKHKLHSDNLYQIFAYVKNKSLEHANEAIEVSGMLLYAKTDAEIQPNNVYRMSGNKISVKTLDLNNVFEDIATQLNTIIKEHFTDIEMQL